MGKLDNISAMDLIDLWKRQMEVLQSSIQLAEASTSLISNHKHSPRMRIAARAAKLDDDKEIQPKQIEMDLKKQVKVKKTRQKEPLAGKAIEKLLATGVKEFSTNDGLVILQTMTQGSRMQLYQQVHSYLKYRKEFKMNKGKFGKVTWVIKG